MANVWQVSHHSLPVTGTVAPSLHSPWLSGEDASPSGLLQPAVPAQAGGGLRGPTCRGSSVILTTRGWQARSVLEEGLFITLDSSRTGTPFT